MHEDQIPIGRHSANFLVSKDYFYTFLIIGAYLAIQFISALIISFTLGSYGDKDSFSIAEGVITIAQHICVIVGGFAIMARMEPIRFGYRYGRARSLIIVGVIFVVLNMIGGIGAIIESDRSYPLGLVVLQQANLGFAGIGEEVVFRGLALRWLLIKSKDSYRDVLRASLYVSVLFGSAHLLNLGSGNTAGIVAQVCYATIFGMVFSYYFALSKRDLLLPMVFHCLLNASAIGFLYQDIGGASPIIGLLFSIGLLAVPFVNLHKRIIAKRDAKNRKGEIV